MEVFFSFNQSINQFIMKKFITILLISLPVLLHGQNQERLSVHYFDIPSNLESDFLAFNKKINHALEEAGYGKNFYKIYKVKEDDTAKKHRYFQISSYTSDKHYEMTHNVGEAYQKIIDGFWDSEVAKAFNKNRIYRKVYRIDH